MKNGLTAEYPVIDVYATGKNIERLRKEKGLSVRDIASFMEAYKLGAVDKQGNLSQIANYLLDCFHMG